jgi:hypothetical protein
MPRDYCGTRGCEVIAGGEALARNRFSCMKIVRWKGLSFDELQ